MKWGLFQTSSVVWGCVVSVHAHRQGLLLLEGFQEHLHE